MNNVSSSHSEALDEDADGPADAGPSGSSCSRRGVFTGQTATSTSGRGYGSVIGTVVVNSSAPVAALKTLTVASSPTTGTRPGGHLAAAVVTSKSTRPCSGVIGSVVAWRWPPGWLAPDRVSQARATSTWMMTAPVPSPAMAPAHSTAGPASVSTTVQTMGLLGTSCGFTAKAVDGIRNAAAATANSVSKSRFIAISPWGEMDVFSLAAPAVARPWPRSGYRAGSSAATGPTGATSDPNQGLSAPSTGPRDKVSIRTSTSYLGRAAAHAPPRHAPRDRSPWSPATPVRLAASPPCSSKSGDEAPAPPVPPRPVHEPLRASARGGVR